MSNVKPQPQRHKSKALIPQLGGDITLYQSKDGNIQLDVHFDQETVWLDAHQLALLFSRDRTVILKHIHNIFQTKELDKRATCAKNAQVAADGKIRQMDIYNLDMIIAVGYRVNSKQGTQFRIWATQILKDHLIKGYSLNEKRLKDQVKLMAELQQTIEVMGRVLSHKQLQTGEAEGLLKIITNYAYALKILDDYDHGELAIHHTTLKQGFTLTYGKAKAMVNQLAASSPSAGQGLFGQEKDQSFKSSIAAIYQTFGGKELYPSIEEKAAHLLYFVVKNHSFVDGNKRIGACLFVWFLDANGILYGKNGAKRIPDNALVALTLMIAESHAKEKDTMTKVIINLINQDN